MSYDGMEEVLKDLPAGWRFSVGHVPHWYRRDKLPKHLKKKPFEAYVINDSTLLGTKGYVFECVDAETPAEALRLAIAAGRAKLAETTSSLRQGERS